MTVAATDCVFCDIVSGRAPAIVIYQDEHAIAFPPIRPAAVGHTLVVPRHHLRDFWDGRPTEVAPVAAAAAVVGSAIRRALRPEGMNLISSAGAVATQSVFHLHLHVIPRWSDDRMGPIWPTNPPQEAPSREQVAALIRAELAGS
ncbi:HIT family protein [Dactylosporangium sp. NPDC049742]|uniref:HIT family protein n=1 Tax=Dactylosporangium sp. NPDC049742 TaxID=3154737 RepID=UPI0034377D0D